TSPSADLIRRVTSHAEHFTRELREWRPGPRRPRPLRPRCRPWRARDGGDGAAIARSRCWRSSVPPRGERRRRARATTGVEPAVSKGAAGAAAARLRRRENAGNVPHLRCGRVVRRGGAVRALPRFLVVARAPPRGRGTGGALGGGERRVGRGTERE